MTDESTPVSLITGASAGIGLAIARALGREGHRLVLVARDPHRLAEAERSLREIGAAEIECHAEDARNTEAMRALIADIGERLGRLDVLVNNAGRADLLPAGESDDITAESAFAVNALGPIAAIAAAWPIFAQQRAGRVLNISSWAALDPFPGFLIYAATKAATNSFTRSIHAEGHEMGVIAHTIGPGAVETATLRSAFDESVVPSENCLTPDHVAELALACARGEHDTEAGRCLYIRMGNAGQPEIHVGD